MRPTNDRRRRSRAEAGSLVVILAGILASSVASAQNCTEPGCTIAEISVWSDEVIELNRGFVNIDVPEAGDVTFGLEADILGVASGIPSESVSLGDAGSVIVKFAEPFFDGPDFDFAVFENGISSGAPEVIFMELGFVEVSSDGVNFARFPSLTSRTVAVGTFEEVDQDEYHNLAGNRTAGIGTEFDLSDLSDDPLVLSGDVDLSAIQYVRIEDVVGNGSRSDDMGNPIYDPFPTSFITGGFDLDAVGAIYLPEPGVEVSLIAGALGIAWLGRRRDRAQVQRLRRSR